MATSFDIPENLFLKKVEDYDIAEALPEDFKQFLDGWLTSAISNFEKCIQSLDYNMIDREITSDLTNDENEILAWLMIVEWNVPKVFSLNNIEMKMSTKDFKAFSQRNHTEGLISMTEYARLMSRKKISRYLRKNIDISMLYK